MRDSTADPTKLQKAFTDGCAPVPTENTATGPGTGLAGAPEAGKGKGQGKAKGNGEGAPPASKIKTRTVTDDGLLLLSSVSKLMIEEHIYINT